MKFAILSTTVTSGGAGIVAANLAGALASRGHQVRVFTMGEHRERRPSFLAERLEIFLCNGLRRDSLFKVSTADVGMPGMVSAVRGFAPDAIIIGWVNQGFLSIGQIEKIAAIAPTAWVMHDMWNYTGICHHSLGCMKFCAECGNCPMIAGPLRRGGDLSRHTWRRKRRLYASVPIKFVAVSEWVKSMAGRSSLLRDYEVNVIHNIYPLEKFTVGRKEPGLIAFGAERLDNPIKGLDHAIEALNLLPRELNPHVAFFGGIKDASALDALQIPYELTGPLNAAQVRELLSRAQVVLNTSHYETFGNTLLEGQASGAWPVSFSRGGQVDIIDHLQSGYLAQFGDVEAIARGIVWGLEGHVSPQSLREAAEAKFSANVVAERYEALFAGAGAAVGAAG